MDLMDVEYVLQLPIPLAMKNAIMTSQQSIDGFVVAFRRHDRSSGRFLLCGFQEDGQKAVPIGVLVTEIDGDVFHGVQFFNSIKPITGIRTTIHRSQIIDWSYVDLWELRGGFLWKFLYGTTDRIRQGALRGNYCSMFELQHPPLLKPAEEALLSDIVNRRDVEAFSKLISLPCLPKIQICFPPNQKSGMIMHFASPTQEMVARYGSNTLVAELQQMGWFNHDVDYPPLCCAARANNLEAIRALVNNGVSINQQDSGMASAIFCAVAFDCQESASWLIENGADVNLCDNGGRTPLFYVKNLDTAKLLLEAGADPTIKSSTGYTVFGDHLSEGRLDIAKLLREYGVGDSESIRRIENRPSVIERGKAAIALANTPEQSEEDHVRSSIDYGMVLPIRSINSLTGTIEH